MKLTISLGGEGQYFKRMQDWGVHCHASNITQEILPLLKEDASIEKIFWAGFEYLIDDLKPMRDDIEHLLSNSSTVIKLIESGVMNVDNKIFDVESEVRIKILKFLSSIEDADDVNDEWLKKWAAVFANLGGSDIANIKSN